ncbi:glycosyltransferase family 1 protein [uncultured Mucilaginibacter sp.]|uniref:glycosyltransferase family 4 protein n=1 Tax=uncultured Mucilaginibacter sp. TaxID=797541 RepID=UPI0025F2AB03|nr:glycosyltransferase family 1 protein [uncultured Mucilaginibacter sp.]
MKILIDHQMFSIQKYGGISRYFANLHSGLNNGGHHSNITALYSENEYIKHEPFLFNNNIGRKLFAGKHKKYYAWNRRYSRWNVKRGNFDVFHPTFDDPYFIKYLKKPCVITIHDMVHELYPQYISNAPQVALRKKAVMEKADAIIAISEFTRQDIIKVYPQMAGKIQVVHHGYCGLSTKAERNRNLPNRYILYVGERWHYKNFARFIAGIGPLLKQDKSLDLICAGGKAFTKNELQIFKELNVTSQCHQMDVTDEVLQQLYTQALCFAFPSLHEGFGLPLLEAFANQCPTICSNSSCLPEVAADAAVYFNPHEPEDIRQAVKKVLDNTSLQQELKQKGSERLGHFTMEACVQNTIRVYQSVL